MVWIGQVVQHARTNHQVEGAANLLDTLDREPMQFEILEIILALKIARVAKARVADVDCRSLEHRAREARTSRPATCHSRRLGFLVSARLLGRPNQMKLGPAAVSVFVEIAMRVQTCERRPDRASSRRIRGPRRCGSPRPSSDVGAASTIAAGRFPATRSQRSRVGPRISDASSRLRLESASCREGIRFDARRMRAALAAHLARPRKSGIAAMD